MAWRTRRHFWSQPCHQPAVRYDAPSGYVVQLDNLAANQALPQIPPLPGDVIRTSVLGAFQLGTMQLGQVRVTLGAARQLDQGIGAGNIGNRDIGYVPSYAPDARLGVFTIGQSALGTRRSVHGTVVVGSPAGEPEVETR